MCCFFSALLFFGPRAAFLVYWLVAPVRVNLSLATFNFPWLVSLLGLIFVPWTMLMFVIVFPLTGFDWIWIGLGLAADIAGYIGGFHHRQRVPGYPEKDPLQAL